MFAFSMIGRIPYYCAIYAMLTLAVLSSASAKTAETMEQRGLPVDGVVLIASVKMCAIAPGDPVMLILSLHNQGRQPQHFGISSNPSINFPLIIQNSKGQQVSLIQPITRGRGSSLTSMLSPNRDLSTIYPISQNYDLSAIGTYRITTIFRIFTPDVQHQSDVVSNTVILTVSNDLSNDFVLTASLKDNESQTEPVVAPGSPVVLQLNLKNVATTARTVPVSESGGEYTLTVQDFRGDVLPLKKDASTALPDDAQLTPKTLQRGDSALSTLRVDTLYDLSQEGRYFITVMRHVPGGQGHDSALVYANTVVVTVKQAVQPAAK
jgi:hypothetical protein